MRKINCQVNAIGYSQTLSLSLYTDTLHTSIE